VTRNSDAAEAARLVDLAAAATLTTSEQDITKMRGRSSLLVASWDTLGWTIYKSPTGHEPARLAEAERYLVAAWHNSLHAEVGLHLGELQEALHRPGEALVTYQLAEAGSSHVDLRGVQQAPTPLQRELTRRTERLKRVRPSAALKDPAGTLHEQLQLGAGSSGGQTLVMPYRMLLTAEGVRSLVPLETSEGD
jgi:hypothetical protein